MRSRVRFSVFVSFCSRFSYCIFVFAFVQQQSMLLYTHTDGVPRKYLHFLHCTTLHVWTNHGTVPCIGGHVPFSSISAEFAICYQSERRYWWIIIIKPWRLLSRPPLSSRFMKSPPPPPIIITIMAINSHHQIVRYAPPDAPNTARYYRQASLHWRQQQPWRLLEYYRQ